MLSAFFSLFNKNKPKQQVTEDRFRDLNALDVIEVMPDGVLILDLTGKILKMNSAEEEIIGYKAKDVVGKNAITTLADKKEYPKLFGSLKQVITKGYAKDIDVKAIREDGTVYYSQIAGSLLRDEKGRPKYVMVVVRDTTEKIKQQRKINELNDALRVVNKILRHDISNDLDVVSFWLDSLSKTKQEEVKDAFTAIGRSRSLITQMKELEEAITSNQELESYNLREVVKKVAKDFDQLETTIQGEGTILADEALYPVIANIMRNAIMHGGSTEMKVTISTIDNKVSLVMADNGSGIPDEAKEKLFTEGFTFGETGNTGLGLYIIKKTMERYRALISVEDSPDKGAQFAFTFIQIPRDSSQNSVSRKSIITQVISE